MKNILGEVSENNGVHFLHCKRIFFSGTPIFILWNPGVFQVPFG
jgi:hypothetical protein